MRFSFNVDKDIKVLKEVLNCNPYQLGNKKWTEAAKRLKYEHGWEVSARTIKERVNNLLSKVQRDELVSRLVYPLTKSMTFQVM